VLSQRLRRMDAMVGA